jgi:hypothetical protein
MRLGKSKAAKVPSKFNQIIELSLLGKVPGCLNFESIYVRKYLTQRPAIEDEVVDATTNGHLVVFG